MDRYQSLTNAAGQIFAGRFDSIHQAVYQDRETLRGWEEPAHLRSVMRQAIPGLAAAEEQATEIAVSEAPYARGAAEPDPGEQREAIGRLLEAGGGALEKVARSQAQDLADEEALGLECVLLLYGRPALLVSQQGEVGSIPAFWSRLEEHRDEIETFARGVGRIELLGHPEYDWASTGFLVSDACLMTTRQTAELFAERAEEGRWQFRPGISAWVDYQPQYRRPSAAACRVLSVIGVHERYDLALLEIESQQTVAGAPVPLSLAGRAPGDLEGRPVYLAGYPARDARRNEPEPIARIFRDVYNVKRVQPGILRGLTRFRDVGLLEHDCSVLGHSAGSCLVDLETQQVIGMHVAGRYLESGSAIPLWMLRDDPLLKRAGVSFVEPASEGDLQTATRRLERLARTRLWGETQEAIGRLYQRALGDLRSEG